MPKRASRKTSFPKAAIVFAGIAVAVFVVGEAFVLSRGDSARLFAARWLRLGDTARVTQIIGRQVREALEVVGVSADSLREGASQRGPARAAWRVGMAHDASLLQANYAITKRLEDHGCAVHAARERTGERGETTVTLEVGLPHRVTHEIRLVRFPRAAGPARADDPRVAMVLFGFDDLDEATRTFDLELPFAVALEPGGPNSQALFRAARERSREVVLHLPLEPINYPQNNPGPGTILVTMNKNAIAQMMKRHFGQAGPVTAVANHMGSLATQDMAVMSAVFGELRRRNLPFLHMNPAPGAVCKDLAADVGVSYEEPDIVIDRATRNDSPKALDAGWKQLLADASAGGSVIAMVRATPLVIDWLPRAARKETLAGVSLVPLAAVIRTPLDF